MNKLDDKKISEALVEVNNTLHDCLSELTKADLDKIRSNYQFKNMSKLRKAELVNELELLIPVHLERIIKKMDHSIYQVIKRMIENGGFIELNKADLVQIYILQSFSIAFTKGSGEELFLHMPSEIMETLAKIDNEQLEDVVKRNTKWVQLTQGMLYYYGFIERKSAYHMVSKLTKEEIDYDEYLEVLYFASDYYEEFNYNASGFTDIRVLNLEELQKEQLKRADIDYYPFTYEQLIEASQPYFIERTPQVEQFRRYLTKNYHLSQEVMEEIELSAIIITNNEIRPIALFDYLKKY